MYATLGLNELNEPQQKHCQNLKNLNLIDLFVSSKNKTWIREVRVCNKIGLFYNKMTFLLFLVCIKLIISSSDHDNIPQEYQLTLIIFACFQ